MRLCYYHDNDLELRGFQFHLRSPKWIKETPGSSAMMDRDEIFKAEITCPACRRFNEEIGYSFWSKEEVAEFLKKDNERKQKELERKAQIEAAEAKEPILQVIERHLKEHDWYYDCSDDPRTRHVGWKHWLYICTLFQRAYDESKLAEAMALHKIIAPARYFPPEIKKS